MQDIHPMLSQLRRPRLLMDAARAGSREYRREAHLSRVLGGGFSALPRPASAVLMLMEREKEIDTQRRARNGTYSVTNHVEVMIALICEARMLARSPELAEA